MTDDAPRFFQDLRDGSLHPLTGALALRPTDGGYALVEAPSQLWKNGVRVDSAVLRIGDVLHSETHAVRLIGAVPVLARNEALEERLRSPDANDADWKVYADWLEEQGDGLAQRIHGPTSRDDDGRALGFFAKDVGRSWLQVSWRRGFIDALTLRMPALTAGESLAMVKRLWEHPLTRFVHALHVEVDVGAQGAPLEEAADVIEWLVAHWRSSLARVTFGPREWPEWTPRVLDAVKALQARLPPEHADLEQLFPSPRPTFFTLARVPHFVNLEAWAVGEGKLLGAREVWRFGRNVGLPDGAEFTLRAELGRFRLELNPWREGPALNGWQASPVLLRDGDHLEPVQGVVFRVDA